MKKDSNDRILGRRLAREISREELAAAAKPGAVELGGASTWSLSYPPDGPFNDHGGGGGIA